MVYNKARKKRNTTNKTEDNKMKKGLNAITEKTTKLWYEVNRKYGNGKYILGVNGLTQIVLSEGYTNDIAVGTNADVQKKLRELLTK